MAATPKSTKTKTPPPPEAAATEGSISSEEAQAQRIAARLGIPYIDHLTPADSPILKRVDSAVFHALQRGASDIHIETREREVMIKYRIDGVLYNAMGPSDKRFHSSLISRIKVMSELDIAEKRVP